MAFPQSWGRVFCFHLDGSFLKLLRVLIYHIFLGMVFLLLFLPCVDNRWLLLYMFWVNPYN